ncbi:MAG: Holliday junction resolvase RuvX [Alphaproteobacteria bacterium]|nr:Holliday junction resolvase RuvX [Alphaproteobacteria bacterium]
MPVLEPLALKAALAPGRRLLGLDVGERTIGLALSDGSLTIATPLETIRRSKFTADAERLKAVIAERRVGGLVVGLPVDMHGGEGRRCQSVRQFAANLLEKIDLPLAFWDERLSTVAVTRTLIDADLSRARRRDVVDKAAAAWILQGLLDRLAAAGRAGKDAP